jgi:putative hemolysin
MAPEIIQRSDRIIDLEGSITHPVRRQLFTLFKKPIEKGLSVERVNNTYSRLSGSHDGHDFCKDCLDLLGVRCTVVARDDVTIPSEGPLIVVSNHPFGGLDGIILTYILGRVRSDFKVLGNYLLGKLPQLKEHLISVDVFEGVDSRRVNARAIREAIRWVRGGGALISFPAGEVSNFFLRHRWVADPAWSPHIAAIIRHAKARAVPVYFEGRNSSLFQLAGMVHPRLRTAMLAREFMNKSYKEMKVYLSKPIPWPKLSSFQGDEQLINYLRMRSYVLRNRDSKKKSRIISMVPSAVVKRGKAKIIRPVSKRVLKQEIHSLPSHQHLAEMGNLSVHIAESKQIPHTIKEIGRLRELTFREVQEGTGKALDLDRFDLYYLHLFLWNEETREVAGAYRLGLADQILRTRGKRGLYTNTLFRFKAPFLARLDNAVELGRSFVRSEYQRKQGCLALLWRGIGEFIAQNPRYQVLFGPVSISREYNHVSKGLMIRFLRDQKLHNELARYVKPRRHHRPRRLRGIDNSALKSGLRDIEDVSALVSEIEGGGKGVPVLLRHYLKLNATILNFNTDRSFSHVVDGLIWVDLTRVEPRLLKRYMGDNAFAVYTNHQKMISEDRAKAVAG